MDYDKKCRSEGGGLIDVVLLGYHDTVGEGQECHSNRLSHYHYSRYRICDYVPRDHAKKWSQCDALYIILH